MEIDFVKQWHALTSAPEIYIAGLALVAAATWWLRSAIASGQIEGLKASNEAKEDRLKLVQDQLTQSSNDLRKVQDELKALQTTSAPSVVSGVSTAASTHIENIITANTAAVSATTVPLLLLKKKARVSLGRDSSTGRLIKDKDKEW